MDAKELKLLAQRLKLIAVVEAKEKVFVKGCYISDLLSWVLAKGKEDELWLTVMGHINVVAIAKLKEFSGVVVCEGAPLDPETKEAAVEHGVPLYTSPLSLYQLGEQVALLLKE